MSITASSVMRHELVMCNSTCDLKEVVKKMVDEKVGSVLIRQDGKVTGIIVDRDILHAIVKGKDFEETQAVEIMSYPLHCCLATDSLERCGELFKKTGLSRLVVKKGEEVVGILLRKFVERFAKVSALHSFSKATNTPRFRTGR